MALIAKTAALVAVSAALLLTPPGASAVDMGRRIVVPPTAACQSALPVFDGNIRKRPKAVQNEGDTSAFVTCSYVSQGGLGAFTSNPMVIIVRVSASDGVADSVSCTGVIGDQGSSFPYVIKSTNVSGNGQVSFLSWTAEDFGGMTFFPSGLFSISCNLNPGVGINSGLVVFDESVGA